jgi:hypothetical protein
VIDDAERAGPICAYSFSRPLRALLQQREQEMLKQQEKKRKMEQERIAQLDLEKQKLQKKREREEQQLEALRAQNKAREMQLV